MRTDQLTLAGTDIAVSQVLGMILFLFSVIMDIVVRVRKKKKNA
jgi:prolipoprotein diacylglyceryltransferase